MSTTLRQLLPILERLAPLRYAEGWDNVGLLVGDPAQGVARILLCIDYTLEVAEEARTREADLVVAYHPPIFEGLKTVQAGSPIFDAIRAGRALYSPHTALDVVEGGTNDLLAELAGLQESRAIRPSPLAVRSPGDDAELPRPIGIGRIGDRVPVERGLLLEELRAGLGIAHLLVAGPGSGRITRVAVGAGACGALLPDVIAQGAQLFLTGELRHHDALRAARAGVTVVCALHSNSERAYLPRLSARLCLALQREDLSAVEVLISEQDRDPFLIW